MKSKDDIVKGTTCFEQHKKLSIDCLKRDCRYWIESEKSLNCTLIEAQKGCKTLQSVGDIFGITRMRVCQIEKKILKKLIDAKFL